MIKNNAKMIGMMIRKYRLEQNMSQEALCEGICAVSYLSKIEKGSVICSDEILSRLFDILGISVPDNQGALEIYQHKINDFFRYFLFSDGKMMETIMAELHSIRDTLLHSYLVLDMMIAEAYYAYSTYDGKADLKSQLLALMQYEDYMDNLQSHRMYLILGMFEIHINNNYPSGMEYYKLAQNRKTDGIVLQSLAIAHYLMGDYFQSITLGDEAYRKLMEDGYIDRATTICSVIAAAYGNFRDIHKMVEYYNRMLALHHFSDNKNQKCQIYYNIGSTYLAVQDYTKALHYLEQSYDMWEEKKEDPGSYILLLQKTFLAHMGLNQRKEAKVCLDLSCDFYNDVPQDSLSSSMKASLEWLKAMYANENYLQEEQYLQALKNLYDSSLKDSHRGFHRFYGDYLIQALKAHRKYKEALQITESIYVKNPLS